MTPTPEPATPGTPDPAGRRIELSVEVPGTPEEVWDAIATGPGISSWFVPHEVEERAGGTATLSFGELGSDEVTVETWDPPHRVVFRGRHDPRGGALAFEWIVEARDGGSCVVRLVNSGFGDGEEWDGDYDGMSAGWPIFLEVLRLHLTHFRGRHARTVVPVGMSPGPHQRAFATCCRAVGLPAGLSAGDELTTTADGLPALHGRVERVQSGPPATVCWALLDAPVEGTAFLAAEGDGELVSVSAYLYLYGDETTAAEVGGQWTAAIAAACPMPAPPPDVDPGAAAAPPGSA